MKNGLVWFCGLVIMFQIIINPKLVYAEDYSQLACWVLKKNVTINYLPENYFKENYGFELKPYWALKVINAFGGSDSVSASVGSTADMIKNVWGAAWKGAFSGCATGAITGGAFGGFAGIIPGAVGGASGGALISGSVGLVNGAALGYQRFVNLKETDINGEWSGNFLDVFNYQVIESGDIVLTASKKCDFSDRNNEAGWFSLPCQWKHAEFVDTKDAPRNRDGVRTLASLMKMRFWSAYSGNDPTNSYKDSVGYHSYFGIASYYKFEVLRVSNLESELRKAMVAYVENQEGDKYDLATAKEVDEAWYCSKLIWKVYKEIAGIDLDKNGGFFVFPDDLYQSSKTISLTRGQRKD